MENSTTNHERKGLTVISEIILVIGIIGVSIMFALVAANVIQFESEDVVSSSQEDVSSDLDSLLESMKGFNGTTKSTYSPDVDQYNLSVLENGTIKTALPGRQFGSVDSQSLDLVPTCISDARTLEIEKTDREVNITGQGPRTVQWEPENGTCRKNRPETQDLGEPEDNATGDRPQYKVAYVPVKYREAEEATFKQFARQAHERFRQVSPFNSCEQPKAHVEMKTIDPGKTEECNIQTCDASFEGGCFDQVKECAASALENDEWDQAVGICDNRNQDCGRDTGNIKLCGRGAGIGERSSVVFYPNPCSRSDLVAPHMMGHSLGLYGIEPQSASSSCKRHRRSCRDPNGADCQRSNANTYVMSFCGNDQRYGPAAIEHLRRVFDRYLWGSCGQ